VGHVVPANRFAAVFLDGPARLLGSPYTVARDRLGEAGGVVGVAAAHECEGEPVGAVSDRDRGHQRLHTCADAGSIAGEAGVAVRQPAPELDERVTQFSVAFAVDALAAAGPAGGLV